jgi:hypothetical protein
MAMRKAKAMNNNRLAVLDGRMSKLESMKFEAWLQLREIDAKRWNAGIERRVAIARRRQERLAVR